MSLITLRLHLGTDVKKYVTISQVKLYVEISTHFIDLSVVYIYLSLNYMPIEQNSIRFFTYCTFLKPANNLELVSKNTKTNVRLEISNS